MMAGQEQEKVGGPFGVKDACEAVVATLEQKANPTLDAFRTVAEDFHRILLRFEALFDKIPKAVLEGVSHDEARGPGEARNETEDVGTVG